MQPSSQERYRALGWLEAQARTVALLLCTDAHGPQSQPLRPEPRRRWQSVATKRGRRLWTQASNVSDLLFRATPFPVACPTGADIPGAACRRLSYSAAYGGFCKR